VLACVLFAMAAHAQSREEWNARIEAEVRAESPEAGDLFAGAAAAAERGDYGEAERLYTQARPLSKVGGHVLRRLCGVRAARGSTAEAIALCREALAVRDSPEN